MIRQQVIGSPVVQKVPAPGTVVVSGGQMFAAPGQQIVVGSNQVISTPGQVSTNVIIFSNTLLNYHCILL